MRDRRPFQIFEGSYDILYQQITAAVLKSMRKTKESNLYQFLKSYSLTKQSADYFKDVTDFKVDQKMAQRKLVQLGRADRKSTRLNSSHVAISYAVFCLKKKNSE